MNSVIFSGMKIPNGYEQVTDGAIKKGDLIANFYPKLSWSYVDDFDINSNSKTINGFIIRKKEVSND